MGIIQVATVRRDVARSWELHIVHAVTPYGVARTVVLFILIISLHRLPTAQVAT
ncbi:MAG: hypothetical protein KatS3mg045_1954 [Bellilinea sp.]|jgi:hypothetical protein|nr:MAG: hypothetical protein KatS3mg045_1865 [Bellilinea sp.]GIV64615.1 MAG: hypothetical protein KatS3mg045_1954 [Bellilinea sp.]